MRTRSRVQLPGNLESITMTESTIVEGVGDEVLAVFVFLTVLTIYVYVDTLPHSLAPSLPCGRWCSHFDT